jgi:hypothetical protein
MLFCFVFLAYKHIPEQSAITVRMEFKETFYRPQVYTLKIYFMSITSGSKR